MRSIAVEFSAHDRIAQHVIGLCNLLKLPGGLFCPIPVGVPHAGKLLPQYTDKSSCRAGKNKRPLSTAIAPDTVSLWHRCQRSSPAPELRRGSSGSTIEGLPHRSMVQLFLLCTQSPLKAMWSGNLGTRRGRQQDVGVPHRWGRPRRRKNTQERQDTSRM